MSDKKFNVLEEAKLFNIYKELYEKILDLLKKYDEPQLIASTLLGQGFRLYKGVLNDKEFNDLMLRFGNYIRLIHHQVILNFYLKSLC